MGEKVLLSCNKHNNEKETLISDIISEGSYNLEDRKKYIKILLKNFATENKDKEVCSEFDIIFKKLKIAELCKKLKKEIINTGKTEKNLLVVFRNYYLDMGIWKELNNKDKCNEHKKETYKIILRYIEIEINKSITNGEFVDFGITAENYRHTKKKTYDKLTQHILEGILYIGKEKKDREENTDVKNVKEKLILELIALIGYVSIRLNEIMDVLDETVSYKDMWLVEGREEILEGLENIKQRELKGGEKINTNNYSGFLGLLNKECLDENGKKIKIVNWYLEYGSKLRNYLVHGSRIPESKKIENTIEKEIEDTVKKWNYDKDLKLVNFVENFKMDIKNEFDAFVIISSLVVDSITNNKIRNRLSSTEKYLRSRGEKSKYGILVKNMDKVAKIKTLNREIVISLKEEKMPTVMEMESKDYENKEFYRYYKALKPFLNNKAYEGIYYQEDKYKTLIFRKNIYENVEKEKFFNELYKICKVKIEDKDIIMWKNKLSSQNEDISIKTKQVEKTLTKLKDHTKNKTKEEKEAIANKLREDDMFFEKFVVKDDNGSLVKNYKTFNSFQEDYKEVYKHKKIKNIVEFNYINHLRLYLFNISWKLTIQVFKLERDMHNFINGLVELEYLKVEKNEGLQIRKKVNYIENNCTIGGIIGSVRGEYKLGRFMYQFLNEEEENKEQFKRYVEIRKKFGIYKNYKKSNDIRNKVMHFHILREDFKVPINNYIVEVDNFLAYREKYKNTAVIEVLEIFKDSVVVNDKIINSNETLKAKLENKNIIETKKVSILKLDKSDDFDAILVKFINHSKKNTTIENKGKLNLGDITIENKIKDLEKEVKKQDNKISSLKNEFKKQKKEQSTKSKDIKKEANKILSLKNEFKQYKKEQNAKIKDLENDNRKQEIKDKVIEDKIKALERLNRRNDRNKITQLENDIKSKKELTDKIAQLEKEVKSKKELTDKTSQLEKDVKNKNKLTDKITKLENEVKNKKNKITQLEKDAKSKKELTDKITKLEKEVKNKKNKITQLEKDAKSKKELTDKITKLEKEVKNKKNKITQLENEVKNKKNKITQLENDVKSKKELTDKITKLEKDAKNKKNTITQLENEVKNKKVKYENKIKH